jgi:hypothetical protein
MFGTIYYRTLQLMTPEQNLDSVGVAMGYGFDGSGIWVRIQAGARGFSLLHVWTGSGAHAAAYPVGIGGPFPWNKAAGV